MKRYWRIEDITPRVLDLSTRWRSVVSFTPRPLYPQGKSPWYTLGRRLSECSKFKIFGNNGNTQVVFKKKLRAD
jgi:hypothetical protein